MTATGRNLAGKAYRTAGEYYTPIEVAAAIVGWLAPFFGPADTFFEGHVGGGAFVRALLDVGVDPIRIEVMDVDPFAPGLALARAAGCIVTPTRPARSVAEAGLLVTPPSRRPTWSIINPPYSVVDRETGPPCKRCAGRGFLTLDPTPIVEPCSKCQGTGIKPRRITVAELHVRECLSFSRHVVALLPDKFLGSDQRNSPDSQRYPVEEPERVFEGATPLFRLDRLRAKRCLYPRVSFTGGGTDSAENYAYWFDAEHGRPTFSGGWLGWKS